jgi:hypothetical protein
VYSSSSAYVACRPLPTAIAAERALRAAPPSGTPPSTRGCIVLRPAGRRGIVLAVAHANGGPLEARLCRVRVVLELASPPAPYSFFFFRTVSPS